MTAASAAGDRVWTASRMSRFGTTIFTNMTRLAQEHGAVNLGQGFPDFDGPEWLKDAAIEAIRGGRNQYARMYGLPELNQAISAHQRHHYDLDYDPEREVTVTHGATEAIAATLLGICEPGDEVVVFAPYYDSYVAAVAMAGATARVVPLLPPDFRFDPTALAAAIGPRTRAVLLNTPQNPLSKVWSRDELVAVGELLVKHDLVLISDEVYEHLTFDCSHLPPACLPGLRERTVTIGSAGKTWSVTGWKIGWACAPPGLTAAVRAVHQFTTFCNGTPFQPAVAKALTAPAAFLDEVRSDYRARRDRMVAMLAVAGFRVSAPAGTYFVLADLAGISPGGLFSAAELADGVRFCQELPGRLGVAAIPVCAFAEDPGPYRQLVRFAFCKRDSTLAEAARRLDRLKPAQTLEQPGDP